MTEQEMSVDDCHCRPMCMPYMIKQTAVEEVDGARVLELMGELSDPAERIGE